MKSAPTARSFPGLAFRKLWSAANRARIQSGDNSPHRKKGFTLIELLVVVTIIVVLLAMLVPAMDSAMYHAKLVKCGANQRALATTMQFYAMDHTRSYPSNTERRHTSDKYSPDMLGQGSDPARDLRPILYPNYVVTYKLLLCPLVPTQVGLAVEDSDPASLVSASYFLFAGWQYPTHPDYPGGSGMFRIGDRLSFTEISAGSTGQDLATSVILMDRNVTCHESPGEPFHRYQGSHPSRAMELREKTRVNQSIDVLDPLSELGTFSIWMTPVGGQGVLRPIPVDVNAAHTDGSVRRYNAVYRDTPGFGKAPLHANPDHLDRSAPVHVPLN